MTNNIQHNQYQGLYEHCLEKRKAICSGHDLLFRANAKSQEISFLLLN